MLISSTIPNLVNGVSQQPDALRLASQSEAQENFLSSVVEGLKRRPGTRHRSKLSTAAWDDAFLHIMNRDINERYLMNITDGDLKVFDLLDGTEKSVSFPDGKEYLDAPSKVDYRAVTVADHTFVVNRQKQVEMLADRTPNRNPQALIYIAGGNYSKTFEITINGTVVASYTTPDGSDKTHVAKIATDYITDQLFNQMVGYTPAPTGTEPDWVSIFTGVTPPPPDPVDGSLEDGTWNVRRIEEVIVVENVAGNAFDLATSDGHSGTYLKTVKDRVQRFSDLPPHGPVGFQCEVVGEASSAFDNYFVEWAGENGSETSGVWEESMAWDIPYALHAGTMPHLLVREADGTFTFKRASWDQREVGDEDSAPEPSFVGRKLRDVFFYRNRLGFVADENVIMSRAGEFYSFWPKTVTTQVDSDPIDVGTTHVKVSILNHAVPFNQNLLLFSSQTQFLLTGGDILSPNTVNVASTTEFEGSADVRPVGAGPHVYFPVTRGRYSGLREYFVEADTLTNNATDVTAHCPKYVPGDISVLASSSNEDILVALSSQEPGSLYVYKYFFAQDGKLQSSWSRWSFGDGVNILNVAFAESRVYMVVQRDGEVFLEEIDIETGATDGNGIDFRVDRKVFAEDLMVQYDGARTTWTLPYADDAPLWVFLNGDFGRYTQGYQLRFTRTGGNQIVVPGDWRGAPVIIGTRYESSYEFSAFLIKEEVAGGGQASVGNGRLQVLKLALDYDQTGYFEVHITPTGRDTSVYRFTGRVLGSGNNRLNVPSLETGRFSVPVLARNTEVRVVIKTDHYLPCAFMSAEWEGRYNTRSKRL